MRDIVVSTLKSHSRMVPVEGDDSVYEVGADGKQLVQRLSAAVRNVAVQSHAALPPTRTKTKGFAGSGTAQDPIRIETAEDLVSMDDPDIAMAGLHFIQTADIDCASITHWPSFAFKGHYDGNGKTIRNVKNNVKFNTLESIFNGTPSASVFSALQATSSVTHLRLEGCCLAETVDGSLVQHCHVTGANLVGSTSGNTKLFSCEVTDGGLVGGDTKGTQITDCQVTNGGLVGGSAIKSKIARCQVIDGQSLVMNQVSMTDILDCAVVAKWSPKNCNSYQGLIAGALKIGSVIARCFVSGDFSITTSDIYFGGVVGVCESGAINQCAVGPLNLRLKYDSQRKRIANVASSVTLQNNASIDTNPGTDDVNGLDGKTVAAARFNQRFFEGPLGWDFDTVWQWDSANNRPALRLNASTGAAAVPPSASSSPTQDLLTRQVQANIWL